MSFSDVICISLILPCESQLTEENCLGLPSGASNFVASEAVGDVDITARSSEKYSLSFSYTILLMIRFRLSSFISEIHCEVNSQHRMIVRLVCKLEHGFMRSFGSHRMFIR